jgi:hypothetical protein
MPEEQSVAWVNLGETDGPLGEIVIIAGLLVVVVAYLRRPDQSVFDHGASHLGFAVLRQLGLRAAPAS